MTRTTRAKLRTEPNMRLIYFWAALISLGITVAILVAAVSFR